MRLSKFDLEFVRQANVCLIEPNSFSRSLNGPWRAFKPGISELKSGLNGSFLCCCCALYMFVFKVKFYLLS